MIGLKWRFNCWSVYCHNFFASQLHLLGRDGVTKSRPHWLRMATAVQERKAEKAGFTRLSCNCFGTWLAKKYSHTVLAVFLPKFWLCNFWRCKCAWAIPVHPFSNVRNVGSGPRSLPLPRLASLSHSHSLRNKYPLSLRNIEACVEAHTIAIKLLSNTCGPNVYVSF